ncbi:MAG: hypothetical protein FJX44_06725 [Alphaproteobacteria bacterium]|nr:hypothetical protein [Alphaproteobacteria bacterium]
MSLLRLIAVMLLAACVAVSLSVRATADPFDKQGCAKLQVEQKKLLTREVQEALAQGPDWVKKHLDPEKIEQVRQYLTVEESVMFRCRPGAIKITWPPPPPLPDRKPPVPVVTASPAETPASTTAETPASTTAETGTPLPDRKPFIETAETKPSQTVADSDKTAASETKATP